MDTLTAEVLALDMNNLTPEDIKRLHDIKARAFAESARKQLAQLKGNHK